MIKANLIIKKVSRIDDKTILLVDSISDGIVKLFGVYNLSDKFNVRLNNFEPENLHIYSHPISDLSICIQLINDYKKIEINDILIPLD